MEIDLRKIIVTWLKDRGHWAVLRVMQIQKAGDADKESGQIYNFASGSGQARNYVDYIVKVDRRKVVPDLMIDTGIGDAAVGVDHFYMERIVPVKEGDLLLEVELDSNGKPITPFVIRQAYKIIDPQDMRDQGGRVEFIQGRVERVNVRV